MKHLRARVAHARHSDRGAVLPILALFIVVLVLATSLAVDIGRLSNRNRDLQKIADLVSLDAVRELGNTNSAALAVTGSSFLQAVQNSAANNGFPVSCTTSATQPNYEADCTSTEAGSKDNLTVDLGLWCTADHVTDASSPCNGATIPANKPGVLVYDTSGNNIPTAVQVTTGDFVKYYFGLGIVNGQSATRSAAANLSATADFGLGTSLANLDTGESALLGPLLNSLFGFNLTTQVVGWEGLASGTVTLNDLATKLGLDVGDSSNLLNTNVSFADFVAATAQALTTEGDVAHAGLLNSIAANIPSPLRNVTLSLSDLFDVGASDVGAALSSKVNVLQVISAAAQVANGTNALTVTPATISLPGVASVSGVDLKVIQPVKFKYRAHVGDSLQAGQASISIDLAKINPTLVTGLLNSLVGGLTNITATISPADTNVGLANGLASLTSVSCSPTPSFTVAVSSGAATVTTTLNFDIRADLKLLLTTIPNALRITGSLTAQEMQSSQNRSLTFSFPPDAPGSAKDAGSGGLFWGTPRITDRDLDVTLLGGITLSAATLADGLLGSLITPLLTNLNTLVIQPMQSLLGLTVGDATVFSGSTRPVPVYCNTPQLVQ